MSGSAATPRRARRGGAAALAALALGLAALPARAEVAVIYPGAPAAGATGEMVARAKRELERDFDVAVTTRATFGLQDVIQGVAGNAAGRDHVVAIGWPARRPLQAAARRYRKTRFTLVDGQLKAAGVRAMEFAYGQAGYLAGIAAARAGADRKAGFIAAVATPPLQRYGCGYLQGLRSLHPEAEIDWDYVGAGPAAFRLTERAAEVARNQVARGAQAVFATGGPAGAAARDAAAQAGAPAIGTGPAAPGEPGPRVLGDVVKRLDVAVYRTVADGQRGEWRDGPQTLGAAERAIAWRRHEAAAQGGEGLAQTVRAARRDLAEGARDVAPPDAVADCV